MYSIGVVDKVTGPVNKIMAKINQMSQQTAAAQDQMMRGAATTVAGGYALARSLAPAIDHVAALGEVQSLGVASDALQKLTKTSFEFGFQFGGNSAEFVRSAYDIQSAINGLNGFELSEFTKTSNILAVATKADAATITSYMGTMYGIFEKTANKMGKANWVNQIAGQTATAVQLYKTTGAEMQAAFSNLGATATNIGLSSAQQFALVGELQLVAKSGSVAGTQAASLLQGIGKAQDALGIKLTDDNGDMLAIDVVLGRINNRLSSLGSVARGDVLTQIFGKQGAKAVDVLSTKVDKLKDSISVFENVQDNSKALEMANIIASPWDRLGGSFNAAATAMGNRLLPVVEPFVEVLASMFAGIVLLTEQFPVLSSVLATGIVVVVGLMTAFGLANVAMGLFKFSGLTLTPVINGLKYVTALYSSTNKSLAASLTLTTAASNRASTASALTTAQIMAQNQATKSASLITTIYAGAINKARIASELFNARLLMPAGLVLSRVRALGFIGTMKMFPRVLAKGFASLGKFVIGLFNATRIMGLLNAIMLANPIGFIVGAVATLAVVIYKFWQPIKAFMSGFWEGFVHSFDPVLAVFRELGEAFTPIINAVKNVFSWLASLSTPVEQSSEALADITSAGQVFGLVFGGLLNVLLFPLKAVIWLITKLVNGITWIGVAISSMWNAAQAPLSSFFDFLITVFGYSPMGLMMEGYGKAFDWLSEKIGGLKGIADSIKDFFNFGEDETKVKAIKSIEMAQPKDYVLQNADQAFSRDYGQKVITNAGQVGSSKVSALYIAANDNRALQSKNVAMHSATELNGAFSHSNSYVNGVINKAVSNTDFNYVSQNNQTSQLTMKSNLLSSTNNLAYAANSPAFYAANDSQMHSWTKNQSIGMASGNSIYEEPTILLPLQSVKTDQNITNSAINSALEIERQKSELQQQNNSYKVKTHRSEFLQSLSKNTTNNQAVSTDNSKRVMIDSLTIKSDNVKRDFDELMELAG